ncbi:envelope glycoprotein L [Meleagrid alphaherpesvirus 1]|nr:envelope glycoprotein L [Meleagrid alphaherpesvirus 1]AKQ48639.1 envelope glycoprotein L [iBAC vector pMeHV1-C7]AKQ48711.1 envelope glycoprotein L [iBAC vector pMeHV1-C9]AKQ48783.1 envelope glycoprotein L [iBAC vector pMeHV1-C10]AKQ48855.1 envelope glycoprotein L [iBAC vector pMeHV1-C17]AKQ48928.1 envelope glycoprotein L [iBAC vector pMeHV1-C18]
MKVSMSVACILLVYVYRVFFASAEAFMNWSDRDLTYGFVRAPNVTTIVHLECIPTSKLTSMRYAEPSSDEVPSGIIIKTNCSLPEFILWYERVGVAAWVNPIIGTSLLLEDVLRSRLDDSVKAGIGTLLSKIAYLIPTSHLRNRGAGCINLYASHDGTCYGSVHFDRFERSADDDNRGSFCRNKTPRLRNGGRPRET